MSLHELDLAERISDRVVCIKDGRMDRCGTPEQVFTPGYVEELFGMTAGKFDAAGGSVEFLSLIHICAYTRSIGPVEISSGPLAPGAEALKTAEENPLYMPDPEAAERAARYLEERMADQDSAGGVVECVVSGLPAGLGEPVFETLDATLARAIPVSYTHLGHCRH